MHPAELVAVVRRTFEAKSHPPGSPERERLNRNAETSEYMPSNRYTVRSPFVMDDGTPHPTQEFCRHSCALKSEAEARAEQERSKLRERFPVWPVPKKS